MAIWHRFKYKNILRALQDYANIGFGLNRFTHHFHSSNKQSLSFYCVFKLKHFLQALGSIAIRCRFYCQVDHRLVAEKNEAIIIQNHFSISRCISFLSFFFFFLFSIHSPFLVGECFPTLCLFFFFFFFGDACFSAKRAEEKSTFPFSSQQLGLGHLMLISFFTEDFES